MTIANRPFIQLSIIPFVIILFFTAGSCHDEGGPCTICPPPIKDPSDYVWSLDTLAYPGSFQTTMVDIWGSAPNDIYAVGHNELSRGTMWHFDGNVWTSVKIAAIEGGPVVGSYDFTAIYGFSQNDVWAVGVRFYQNQTPLPKYTDSSLIIHFDGNNWTEHKVTGGGLLTEVFGVSPDDVWVGGGYGTYFHFNGNTWTKVSMSDSLHCRSISGFSSNDVYSLLWKSDLVGQDSIYLAHWNGNAWSIQDSFKMTGVIADKFGRQRIFALEGELYSAGRGVFKKTNTGWENIFSPSGTFSMDVFGVSLNSLFVVGTYGGASYFNGQAWMGYSTLHFPSIHYQKCWTNGVEAFIVGYDDGGSKSYVMHGK